MSMEAEQARLRFNAVTTRKRPGIYPPVFQEYFPPTVMIALPMALVCFSIAMIKNSLMEKGFIRLLDSSSPWERHLGSAKQELEAETTEKSCSLSWSVHNPGPPAEDGTVHKGLDPPTSTSNQENQTYRQANLTAAVPQLRAPLPSMMDYSSLS